MKHSHFLLGLIAGGELEVLQCFHCFKTKKSHKLLVNKVVTSGRLQKAKSLKCIVLLADTLLIQCLITGKLRDPQTD